MQKQMADKGCDVWVGRGEGEESADGVTEVDVIWYPGMDAWDN